MDLGLEIKVSVHPEYGQCSHCMYAECKHQENAAYRNPTLVSSLDQYP